MLCQKNDFRYQTQISEKKKNLPTASKSNLSTPLWGKEVLETEIKGYSLGTQSQVILNAFSWLGTTKLGSLRFFSGNSLCTLQSVTITCDLILIQPVLYTHLKSMKADTVKMKTLHSNQNSSYSFCLDLSVLVFLTCQILKLSNMSILENPVSPIM